MAQARLPLKVRRIDRANKEEEEKQIPHDVLIDILSRIPASSLVRFKCVSKHWHSLICDPYFIDLHLHRTRKAHHPCIALLYNCTARVDDKRLAFLDEEAWSSEKKIDLISSGNGNYGHDGFMTCKYPFMTQSCNGMFCLYDDNGNIQLCNPTTRQLRTLPKPHGDPPFAYARRLHFGFHPVTKEYKVLYYVFGSYAGCKVFTLGTGLWHKISHIGFPIPRMTVTVNGAIHWLGGKWIVSFDLEDENFRTIPFPTNISSDWDASLVELEGNICFVHTRFGARYVVTSMDMWILQDCTNDVWIHKHHIELNQSRSKLLWNLMPIFIQKGKMWLTSTQGLRTYNLETNKQISEEVYPIKKMDNYVVRAYVESLAWMGNP